MQRAEVLDHARNAVLDRPNQYGAPEQNFDRIAARWNVHLLNAHPDDVKRGDLLTAVDVAIMLADMKLARLEADPTHGDSWADVAGYAACGGEVSKATSAQRVKLELASVPAGPKRVVGHPGIEVGWGSVWVGGLENRRNEQAAAQEQRGAAFHTDRDFADENVENREFKPGDLVEFYHFDKQWAPGKLLKKSTFYTGRWSVTAENGRVWVKPLAEIRPRPQAKTDSAQVRLAEAFGCLERADVQPPCDVSYDAQR